MPRLTTSRSKRKKNAHSNTFNRQHAHISSLSQYLCEPLIRFLKENKGQTFRKSKRSSIGDDSGQLSGTLASFQERPNPNYYTSSGASSVTQAINSEQEEVQQLWMWDKSWETLLLDLKVEIEVAFEENRRRSRKRSASKLADDEGANAERLGCKGLEFGRRSSSPVIETGKFGYRTLGSTLPVGTSDRSPVLLAGRGTSAADAESKSQSDSISSENRPGLLSFDGPPQHLDAALTSTESSDKTSKAPGEAPGDGIDENNQASRLIVGIASSVFTGNEIQATSTSENRRPAEERQGRSQSANIINHLEAGVTFLTRGLSTVVSFGNQDLSRAKSVVAYLIPVESYTPLPAAELQCTVLARLFGQKLQTWFNAHQTATKRIVWFLLLVLLCFVLMLNTLSTDMHRVGQVLVILVNTYMLIYFSSRSNWAVTISAMKRFDLVFMTAEIALFVASVICMQYTRYQYLRELEQIGKPSILDEFSIHDFIIACSLWLSLGGVTFLMVLFCDGFSSKDKVSMRYLYTAMFLLLFLLVLLGYWRVLEPPRPWLTSHVDLYRGLTYTSDPAVVANSVSISENHDGPHRIRLFDFWLNRGFTVCIFGFRMCISSFLHPHDFVFIKSRMKILLQQKRRDGAPRIAGARGSAPSPVSLVLAAQQAQRRRHSVR